MGRTGNKALLGIHSVTPSLTIQRGTGLDTPHRGYQSCPDHELCARRRENTVQLGERRDGRPGSGTQHGQEWELVTATRAAQAGVTVPLGTWGDFGNQEQTTPATVALLCPRVAMSAAQPSPASCFPMKVSVFKGAPKTGNTPARREHSFRDVQGPRGIHRPVLKVSSFLQPVHTRPTCGRPVSRPRLLGRPNRERRSSLHRTLLAGKANHGRHLPLRPKGESQAIECSLWVEIVLLDGKAIGCLRGVRGASSVSLEKSQILLYG